MEQNNIEKLIVFVQMFEIVNALTNSSQSNWFCLPKSPKL